MTTSTASSSPRRDARADVRGALRALGVRPARRLGQSFLVDEHIADAEAALVADGAGPYLEVGPGLGALTAALDRRGIAPLTLLERDVRLAAALRAGPGGTRVVTGDATDYDLTPFGTVVGNLPFAVATPILLRAARAGVPRTVALVQEEVAQRIAARPGSGAYGRLTVALAAQVEAELFLPVPAEAFEPVPEVSGRVVVLTRRQDGPAVADDALLETLTRTLFAARRKQLKNLLPAALPKGLRADAAAAAAEWPSDWATRRPEELPPAAFFRLTAVVAARRSPSRPAAAPETRTSPPR